ncbi:ATPase [Methanobrevibacter sp.]
MNDITIILWITIALIAIIAIILVKLHYKGDELEKEEGSILPSAESINNALNMGKSKINSMQSNTSSNQRHSLSPNTSQQNPRNSLFRNSIETVPKDDAYIVPEEIKNNNLGSFEYESQNQILINYDNTVEKFQEPIKQNQMDIMTQNNKDTAELKDLFTIDELIKESKRKDSEREKEAQKIKKDEDDAELSEIKESIKNKTEEPLIEEIINEEKEEKISDLIKDTSDDNETPSVATQKDIDEAIDSAAKESKKEVTIISEDKNITNVLLNQENEEISEPALKTPSKVDETKDYKLGASIDDANLFDESEEDTMDLDYRKDLDKFTNKIKGSKIFQEVKDKLSTESEEIPEVEEETYIRNVNEYDPYEPIINETHIDYEDTYEGYHEQRIRQENTRKIFNMSKNSPNPEVSAQTIGSIRSKPARDNIKITLNNNEVVLKKGDEIIYNHLGETYSSQVYAINGDDISVRYRRKDITIKPSDVKKIY